MLPIRQLNAPLAAVAIPAMSRLAGNPLEYRRYYIRALSLLTAICVPLSMAMLCLSRPIVVLVLGERWIEAVDVFRLLAISLLVQPVMNSCGWIYISQGRTKSLRNWGICASLALIASFVIGLPLGIRGVAASYAACMIILAIPCVHFALRGTSIRTGEAFKLLIGAIFATTPAVITYAIAIKASTPLANSMGLQLVTGLVLFTSILPLVIWSTGNGGGMRRLLSLARNERKIAAVNC
jgi:PST family polysaccharide transporter